MRKDETWYGHRQISVAHLIEMKQVGLELFHECHEVGCGIFQVLLPLLHPIEAKRGGKILQRMQPIHPSSFLRKGNLAKANKRNANAAAHETSGKLARVCPDSAQCVGRDKDVQIMLPGCAYFSANQLGVRENFLSLNGLVIFEMQNFAQIQRDECSLSAIQSKPYASLDVYHSPSR